MTDRNLKIALLALIGLFALVAVGDNLVNLPAAHGAVAYVIGQTDHGIYPNAMIPPLGPQVAWVVLAIICSFELATGLLCLTAAARLHARRFDADAFERELPFARVAASMFVFTWFGLFWIGGVGLFVMWQTPAGAESGSSAFHMAAIGFMTLLYLGQRHEAPTA